MDVLRRIFRRPNGRIEVPGIIDHMPVSPGSRDWREERLQQAQQRYGRPFKCAAAELPREILVRPRPPGELAPGRLADAADEKPRAKPRPRRPSSFRFGSR
ncbi:MAG TPA: hypothetical protein VHP37_30935 [Burkholderiales bacterium]|nr:hypothetical protein [Burkholderiales bacterium]